MQEIWENLYKNSQQLNRYPWDSVVSFLYRHAASQSITLKDMRILEIGCGSASNLWFAAREGATVYGTDYSQSAIDYAQTRFKNEELIGEFSCCSLPDLPPLPKASFDCIVDRCCLTVCDDETVLATHAALVPLLKPTGKFLSTFYGQKHSSYLSGAPQENGLTTNITAGTLSGVGPVAFYDQVKTESIFSQNWNIVELTNITKEVMSVQDSSTHEEWQMVASPPLKTEFK